MNSCHQQEVSSTAAKDMEKNLIVGLSLYKSSCMMAWETKKQLYISNLKVSF